MAYQTTIRGEHFHFADLREVFARANEEKSGDRLAGIAADSERERVAAKLVLADVTLGEIVDHPLIDPDGDDVSRLLLDTLDHETFRTIRHLTVGQFRELLLDDASGEAEIRALQWAILPEVAAATAKLMSNKDLVLAAAKVRNVTRCRNTLGKRGVLGIRVQPNHPADDVAGILLAAADGLLFGCGDAVLGVNPAAESVDTVSAILSALHRLIETLGVPTQACCLAHITTQLACVERGVPVDLLFQSIAGTQAANASFGVTLSLLREGRERVRESHRLRDSAWVGDNVMYFETGQGSALSADAHHGVDQLTLEARPTASRAFSSRSCSTASSASSVRSTSTTSGRSCGRGWKTTSWASCWACRWVWTSATPTTPRPTRTRPITCCCCWRRPVAITSWACRAPMTLC